MPDPNPADGPAVITKEPVDIPSLLPLGPRFPFSLLLRSFPNLSPTQLLNANNHPIEDVLLGRVNAGVPPTIPASADVVIAGAGMAGLLYAIELKAIADLSTQQLSRPETSIVVLEKSLEPGYKVGESALSAFTRFCNKAVLPEHLMLRLFSPKEGLDFIHVDRRADSAAFQYEDIGGLDISYQLERRVSELLLTMRAQQLGVKVFYGATVVADSSDLRSSSTTKTVSVALPETPNPTAHSTEIRAKVVGDGTGLARALAATESPKSCSFEGMNYNSYWAYFKEDMHQPEDAIRHWLSSASSHICYKEGWSWWIRLLSWKDTPTANLMDYIHYLLALHTADISPDKTPTIQVLARAFNCTYNSIVSIGFVVRNDTLDELTPAPYVDESAHDGEHRFWSIVHTYPTIERILRSSGRYTLLRDYYGKRRGTFFSRRNMAYYQDTVAGDGWYALGITAGFTSPLFSPGIVAICLPTAFVAARLTARQLSDFPRGGGGGASTASSREAVREYSEYVRSQIQGLRTIDVILHCSYKDRRLFRAVFPLFFANALQSLENYAGSVYRKDEPYWTYGARTDHFPAWSGELLPLLLSPEIDDEIAAKVEAICARYISEMVALYGSATKYSKIMRYRDDQLQENDRGYRHDGIITGTRCSSCKHNNFCSISEGCLMCGKHFIRA
ncbi:hypothetical protein DFJ73DRAFT_628176 [Zopfochytrium polystomum]|nr:hypothetical protein DFJ73DRAFT_628176 [Zopfochytrium polystomum]